MCRNRIYCGISGSPWGITPGDHPFSAPFVCLFTHMKQGLFTTAAGLDIHLTKYMKPNCQLARLKNSTMPNVYTHLVLFFEQHWLCIIPVKFEEKFFFCKAALPPTLGSFSWPGKPCSLDSVSAA